MNALLLTIVIGVPMPAPAWAERNPMPPPVVQPAPTGLLDTIRAAKALIAKGNALADRGKQLLDAAQRDGKIRLGVILPDVPVEIVVVEVEELVEPEEVELIRPPTPPVLKRLPGPRNLFRCPDCGDYESGCDMFLGNALLSMGHTDAYLQEIGRKQWGLLYDNTVNSRIDGPVSVQSGCPDGRCRTGMFSRLRSRRGRR